MGSLSHIIDLTGDTEPLTEQTAVVSTSERITSENEPIIQNLVTFTRPFFSAASPREELYPCIMAVIAYRFAHEMPFDMALCRYMLSMDCISEATSRLTGKTKEWVFAFALVHIAIYDTAEVIESDPTLFVEHKNRLKNIKKIFEAHYWSGRTGELIEPFQSDSIFVNAIFLLFTNTVLKETHSGIIKKISWFLLFHSVMKGDAEILKILLSNAVDINQQHPESGNTPLHYAAELDRTAILKLLLAHNKSQLELPNKKGLTPLQRAVVFGKADAVRVLLKYGACMHTTKFPPVLPALDMAKSMGNSYIINILEGFSAQSSPLTQTELS